MLWERQPEAMSAALGRHDDLIAAVVEAHRGRLLKSMGEGDSTVSVFASAPDAVRAAIEAAQAIDVEPWPAGLPIRARFGLHTGEAQRRGGDYFGSTVNRAARVRGEARGGEILLSDTTAALVAPALGAGYTLADLGPHRLRGIEAPEAIKAVVGRGLATPPAAADCPYRGLLAFEPSDRHLFFGREDVVADLLARVAAGQLLAVVGASGSGKSSLLRAGLIAAVEEGEVGAAASARLMHPGREPAARPGRRRA